MYAQINYHQNLGDGPATLANAGCFVTAFSNLLERFGENVDPPALNNYFLQHGVYIAENDGGRIYHDLLAWGTISAYDGLIATVQVGGVGWPDSNEAIVKFIYRSSRSGQQITHFCLVADASAGTIVDSYDGIVKHSPYGTPIAWAKYERHTPQPIAPPAPPPEALAYTLENIAERNEDLKIDAHLWDLNQRSWPGLVNNPIVSVPQGTKFKTVLIAHHMLGGSYYIPEGQPDNHGYNIIDCEEDSAAPPPATPVPEVVVPPAPAPLPSGALNPGGNPDNKYTVIKTIAGYGNGTNAGNHVNQTNEVAAGDYFVYNTHPNNAELINVTSNLGQPGSWINKADNVIDIPVPPPIAPAEAPPAPPTPPAPTEPTMVVSVPPIGWQDTFKPFPKPIHYVSTRELIVGDLSGKQSNMPLVKHNPGTGGSAGVVSVFGTVTKDGVDYYRLKTNNDPTFSYWYAIPKLDANTRTPNLLVVPTNTEPVSNLHVVRDTLELAKARLEQDVPRFLDDIVPKWLRNKK